jgi:DNA polymerase III subunit gamma/tau
MNLYNKYRPSTLDELKGQDQVVEVIKSHLKDHTLPHFLIFYGFIGTGKTTLARIVANILNPSKHGIVEKDCGNDGGKDDMRLLVSELYNKPLVGDHKTYIIEEAHLLTKQAFTALLKPTEEPPSHVTFIFTTTDFDKIPANIKSRAKSFSFNKLNHLVIKDRLLEIAKAENEVIPDEIINLVTNVSSGSLRNAIVALETVITAYKSGKTVVDIADVLGVVGYSRLFSFVKSTVIGDFKKMHQCIATFCDDKTDSLKAVYDLQQFIMDCRIYLTIKVDPNGLRSDISNFITWFEGEFTQKIPADIKAFKKSIGGKLDTIYDLTLELESNLKRTSNKEALFTRFLIKLAQATR